MVLSSKRKAIYARNLRKQDTEITVKLSSSLQAKENVDLKWKLPFTHDLDGLGFVELFASDEKTVMKGH